MSPLYTNIRYSLPNNSFNFLLLIEFLLVRTLVKLFYDNRKKDVTRHHRYIWIIIKNFLVFSSDLLKKSQTEHKYRFDRVPSYAVSSSTLKHRKQNFLYDTLSLKCCIWSRAISRIVLTKYTGIFLDFMPCY